MINLQRHRRLQIPNSLAIAAALLLVASSIVGFEANHESGSAERTAIHESSANSSETDNINRAVKTKAHSFSIGSLLFPRG